MLLGELLPWLQREGIVPSPLFGCPGFHLHLIAIDILHALDLGFTQDGTQIPPLRTPHPCFLPRHRSKRTPRLRRQPRTRGTNWQRFRKWNLCGDRTRWEPLLRVTHLWFLQWCHETKGGRLANHVEGTLRFLQDSHSHLHADGGDDQSERQSAQVAHQGCGVQVHRPLRLPARIGHGRENDEAAFQDDGPDVRSPPGLLHGRSCTWSTTTIQRASGGITSPRSTCTRSLPSIRATRSEIQGFFGHTKTSPLWDTWPSCRCPAAAPAPQRRRLNEC